MSEENPKPSNDNRQRQNGGQDPQLNWRGLVLFAIAFALIGGAFLFRGNNFNQTELIQYPKFIKLVKEGKLIVTPEAPLELVVEEGRNTQYFEGKVKMASRTTGEEGPVAFRTPIFTQFNGSEIDQALTEAGITPAITPKSDLLASAVLSFLPIVLFLIILYFFFRSQIKMAGKGALNFGKSKARMLAKDKNRITFKDVAGVEEAKDEVQELVEFLKDPKKFQNSVDVFLKAFSWWVLLERVKRFSLARSPVRLMCLSFRSADRTSWKCLSVSAPPAFATCSSRAKSRPRA